MPVFLPVFLYFLLYSDLVFNRRICSADGFKVYQPGHIYWLCCVKVR